MHQRNKWSDKTSNQRCYKWKNPKRAHSLPTPPHGRLWRGGFGAEEIRSELVSFRFPRQSIDRKLARAACTSATSSKASHLYRRPSYSHTASPVSRCDRGSPPKSPLDGRDLHAVVRRPQITTCPVILHPGTVPPSRFDANKRFFGVPEVNDEGRIGAWKSLRVQKIDSSSLFSLSSSFACESRICFASC